MGALDIPAEIFQYIFELLEDNSVFDHALPTCMTLSHWDRKWDQETWTLIDPLDSMYVRQRERYSNIKAIIFTCRQWYRFGHHLLYRSLFLSNPSKLAALCYALDRNSSLGWYTKRLHLVRFYATRRMSIADLEHGLISIIQQCPNLEIFTADCPIAPSFLPIADTLCSFSWKSLRTVHWTLTPASLPRLIWALDSLSSLVSAHIDFEFAPPSSMDDVEESSPRLGAASQLALELPCLEQLSLRGLSQDFLGEAAGWSFPALRSFSLDFVANRHDLPDVVDFLAQHGEQLTFLDLNTLPSLDLSAILELCPELTTFAFNPDWRLPFHVEVGDPFASPTLLRTPHPHIMHIGLHQLVHAFVPGRASAVTLPGVATLLIQRTNDLTFAQLTRRYFPALRTIRVLNRVLLKQLERNDGPDKDSGCFARWERWHDQCAREGVRLEDCTGALMGELPLDQEDYDSEESDGEDEYTPSNVQELRDLLEECKRMSVVH